VTAAAGLLAQTHGLATGRLARITRRSLSGSSPELSVDDLLQPVPPALEYTPFPQPERPYVTRTLLGPQLPSDHPLAKLLPPPTPPSAILDGYTSHHLLPHASLLHVDLSPTLSRVRFTVCAPAISPPLALLACDLSPDASRPAAISDARFCTTFAALNLAVGAFRQP
jgi:hypothetical protein